MVGMAVGAGMSAIQGGDLGDIVLGAALGGASAGFMAAPGQAFVGFSSGTAAATGGIFSSVGGSVLAEGVSSAATSAMTGSMLGGMLIPPSNEGYTQASQITQQQQQFQQMNTNVATTGSGGRQAAKSLATAISRSKKRKLTQRDVRDLSLDTSSFTNTGLQLA